MGMRAAGFIVLVLMALSAPGFAQEPEKSPDAVPTIPDQAPPPAPRTMVGTWEFSNADREKICTVIFRNETLKAGKRLEFDPKCASTFPFISEIAGWRYSESDFLRLVDAQGNSVLEFSEVENGIFEAPKPGEGILFIQNPTALGPPPKTAEQMFGDWTIIRRTGAGICSLTLSNTAQGEEFVLTVQPGCDPVVTRFAPVTWAMDRGELVFHNANGQGWRFEEGEDQKWPKVPATANPLWIMRK